jgi:hypothetical protein
MPRAAGPGLVPTDEPGLAVSLGLEAGRGVAGPLDGEDLDRRLMPFSRRSPSERRKKSASTSCWVTSLITTMPGSAACWIRAARLGTRPTIESRSATALSSLRSVTTTRPVWMPTRPRAPRRSGGPVRPGVAHRDHEVEAGEHRPAGVVLVRAGCPKPARMPSPEYCIT